MWFNNVWRPLFQGFYQFLGEGADVVDIPIGASATWGVAGSGLRLVSEMSMPGDLAVADAEEEPEEPDDSDDDDFPNDDDSETGKDAPPEVKIRSYRDSPICDVVIIVHGTEMVLRCPDYSQAVRWARLERKSYKIPEPDIDVAAKAESQELPLFLRSDRN